MSSQDNTIHKALVVYEYTLRVGPQPVEYDGTPEDLDRKVKSGATQATIAISRRPKTAFTRPSDVIVLTEADVRSQAARVHLSDTGVEFMGENGEIVETVAYAAMMQDPTLFLATMNDVRLALMNPLFVQHRTGEQTE